MIFSIHIPKTAGTSFRFALEERYGSKLALYYGQCDPKTTEGLRVRPQELAAAAANLADRGFEVLHGHYALSTVAALSPDPASVWTWLRDPVERTLSHYEFYRQRPNDKPLAREVRAGETTLKDFQRAKGVHELQSRYLKGADLADLGFVGISEHFDLGLSLLFGEGGPRLKRRYNAVAREVAVTAAERASIARSNIRDMQLYAGALRLFVQRVAAASGAVVSTPAPGLLDRLIRSVR